MTSEGWPCSHASWERAKKSLGGGVSTGMRASMKPHPLFFEAGSGPRLTDVDGNTYLDYVLGWGPVLLGHGHPALTAAVGAQLPHGATYGSGHRLEYEVAEQVLEAIPGAERVLWSNTGTEAVQTALRLARAATGKRRFVKFVGHYHGWSDPMLVGYRPGTDGRMPSLESHGQNPGVLEDVVLADWGELGRVQQVLTGSSDIAAVFVEPVLCNSGVIPPPEGFLAGLRELCDATGTVLIFDEVITGFRVAYGGAAERYGTVPDLVVLAKAIAAGFPLAALAGRAHLIDKVTQGVVHAGTYNGNPVVLAAAGATLETLREPGTYERFEAVGSGLADGIRGAFADAGATAAVNQVGPVVQCCPGISRCDTFEDFLRTDQGFYDRLTIELLRRGIFTLPGGRWYLSTTHTPEDVAETVTAFRGALTRTLEEGPGPESDR